MSHAQAMATVRAAYPDRSICISEQYWCNRYEDNTHVFRTAYSISILPGVDGKACSSWSDASLECVVRLCLAARDRAAEEFLIDGYVHAEA